MGLLDFLPGFQQETPPDGCVRASHILFLSAGDEFAEKKADGKFQPPTESSTLICGFVSFNATIAAYSPCSSVGSGATSSYALLDAQLLSYALVLPSDARFPNSPDTKYQMKIFYRKM